jgi:hypothetical protein
MDAAAAAAEDLAIEGVTLKSVCGRQMEQNRQFGRNEILFHTLSRFLTLFVSSHYAEAADQRQNYLIILSRLCTLS